MMIRETESKSLNMSWELSTAQRVVGGQGALAPRDAPAAYRTQGLCRGGGLTRRPAMNERGP